MTEALAIGDPFRLCGGVLAERFRVHSTIAEGGFGVVYRGTQLVLDRPVAIKVLKTPPQFSGEALTRFRERFADEAKIIARLKHPHIVDVYDFGVDSTQTGGVVPWMALEWLNGVTLEKDLEARGAARRGGRSPGEVLALMRPILQAFAMAHRQGIVHRDIKPANIMLTQDAAHDGWGDGPHDGSGGRVPKILDFGISKIVETSDQDQGNTGTSGMPAFSPAYAAPEQVTFSRTGTWTDVHALGLVLSELLTGRAPYAADGLHLFEQVMLARRPTPRSCGVDVGAWEEVLEKALALAPGARYQNAAELLAALEARAPQRTARAEAAHAPPAGRGTLPLEPATGAHAAGAGGTKVLPPAPEAPSASEWARPPRSGRGRRPPPSLPTASARRWSGAWAGLLAALVAGGIGVVAAFALRPESQRPSSPAERPSTVSKDPSPTKSVAERIPPPHRPTVVQAPSEHPLAAAPDAAATGTASTDTTQPSLSPRPRQPVVLPPGHARPHERPRTGGSPNGSRPKAVPLQPLPIEIE